MANTQAATWRLERLDDRCLPSTYVVAPAGTDAGPGTFNQPFATIQHALDVATRPGDVIQVRGGTYRERLAFPASGTAAGGFITLTAYPGERPLLDGTGLGGGELVSIRNVSFVRLAGFEIAHFTGVTDGAAVRVWGGGTNVEVRNNTVHDVHGTRAVGIGGFGTSARALANLFIDANEVYDVESGPRGALTLSGNVTGFRVTGNLVHSVVGTGIDLAGDRAVNPTQVARDGLARGNTVFGAHAADGRAAGLSVDAGRNILLEYNVAHDNDVGLEVTAEARGLVATGITVRNNLVYRNAVAGLALGGPAYTSGRVQLSSVYNNTLYQNDTAGWGPGQVWLRYASQNALVSNLVWAAGNNVLLSSAAGNFNNTLARNLYFAPGGVGAARFTWNGSAYFGLSAYQAGARVDLNSSFADPRLADPANGDFHLRADSPAVDAGSPVPGRFAPADFDGRLRPYWGEWPDIGAFEYTDVSPPPGPYLSADQKRRAEQLTSIFENDTIELQYGYAESLGDGRGVTAGRAGFTSATGDLLDVVERYTARVPGNPLSAFLVRLRQLARAQSGSVDGLNGIRRAWQESAADPLFRAVQDRVVDETYYWPAVAHASELGLRAPLAIAAVYDAIIQHGDGDDPDGLPALLSRTASQAGGTPATGIDERVWLDRFLRVRRADLTFAYNPATRAVWAQSVARVDVLRDLAAAGNYDLTGPIHVTSDVYTDVTIP